MDQFTLLQISYQLVPSTQLIVIVSAFVVPKVLSSFKLLPSVKFKTSKNNNVTVRCRCADAAAMLVIFVVPEIIIVSDHSGSVISAALATVLDTLLVQAVVHP